LLIANIALLTFVVMLYQLHVSWQNANIPEHWYDIVFVMLQQLHASCQNWQVDRRLWIGSLPTGRQTYNSS